MIPARVECTQYRFYVNWPLMNLFLHPQWSFPCKVSQSHVSSYANALAATMLWTFFFFLIFFFFKFFWMSSSLPSTGETLNYLLHFRVDIKCKCISCTFQHVIVINKWVGPLISFYSDIMWPHNASCSHPSWETNNCRKPENNRNFQVNCFPINWYASHKIEAPKYGWTYQ